MTQLFFLACCSWLVVAHSWQVIPLCAVVPSGSNLLLAFEYCRSDLAHLLAERPQPFQEAHTKSFLLMLMQGVAYLHHIGVMHRVRMFRTAFICSPLPRLITCSCSLAIKLYRVAGSEALQPADFFLGRAEDRGLWAVLLSGRD